MRAEPNTQVNAPEAADLKDKEDLVEDVESGELQQWATYINGDTAHLSQAHRDYLMERHGTLDLDPIPGFGDADPLNWKTWKVCLPYTKPIAVTKLTVSHRKS